jgi:hypothetical protein
MKVIVNILLILDTNALTKANEFAQYEIEDGENYIKMYIMADAGDQQWQIWHAVSWWAKHFPA